MQKTDIRKSLVDARLAQSDLDASRKSIEIQRRFLDSILYRDAGVIALYSSFNGEVKTDLLLESVEQEGKVAVMPRINWSDSSMKFIAFGDDIEMVDSGNGFKEPLPGKGLTYEISDIDVFVVPGVAYDVNGNRLGMGKGFYDRALVHVDSDHIVAFAYEFQLIESVPSSRHDKKVGWIFTEKKMINIFENKVLGG